MRGEFLGRRAPPWCGPAARRFAAATHALRPVVAARHTSGPARSRFARAECRLSSGCGGCPSRGGRASGGRVAPRQLPPDSNEIVSVQNDLPRGYYRRLPRPPRAVGRGRPRIELVARALIEYSDARLDAERLRGFLLAFQSVAPLTIGELWALPSIVKAALVSHLADVSQGLLDARAAVAKRGRFSRRLRGLRDPRGLGHRRESSAPVSRASLAADSRIRSAGSPVCGRLEARLAAQGLSPEDTSATRDNARRPIRYRWRMPSRACGSAPRSTGAASSKA